MKINHSLFFFASLIVTLTLFVITTACAGADAPSASPTHAEAFGYTLAPLESCGDATLPAHARLVLFDAETNRLVGWSHINTAVNAYQNAVRETAVYRINADNTQPDPTCNNQQTFQAILVKKYVNWDQQHANGIEPQFGFENISFGQLDSIVLDLKVESERSHIFTNEQLQAQFGDQMTSDQLQAWENGNVNLAITLFEDGYNQQSTPTFHGSLIIDIDQAQYDQQWLRLTIPAQSLNYYTEMNWERTPAEPTEFADHTILGLRINPETKNGNVLRHYMPEPFDTTTTEYLKEMGLTISQLAIILKEQ